MTATNVFIAPNATVTLSRHELLAWVNGYTGHNVTKVEDLSAGSAYCVMFNVLFPGSVAMGKIKINTKLEHEKLANLKALQLAFSKHKVDKNIPIDRLVKGRFQDNFEFLQWFKVFFDANYSGQDPPSVPVSAPTPQKAPAAAASSVRARTVTTPQRTGTAASRAAPAARAASPTKAAPTRATGATHSAPAPRHDNSAELEALKKQVAELTVSAEALEKERDFYFHKLLEVETICQEGEGAPAAAEEVAAAAPVADALLDDDETY
eukprot:comp24262_c4_seq6/m.45072 comp24262_c4_seq6/g.45072  ORF comp24262_c4_seq6/g.45072 comp24262_c4_seq6/m.45072 type:complete len:265 (-) comp24262_c4_seq6:442-1236(-)